jgi:hypothetical protein
MAFADPIVLNDDTPITPVAQNFVLASRLLNGSEWIEDDASGTTDVRRLSIRHSNAGPSTAKGQFPVRRHLFQVTHEKYNATTLKIEKVVVNVTITVDPGASITVQNQKDALAFARNFVTGANLLKLLRDET